MNLIILTSLAIIIGEIGSVLIPEMIGDVKYPRVYVKLSVALYFIGIIASVIACWNIATLPL